VVTGRRRGDDFVAQFAPDLVDGDERVGALVYISSNNNHGGCLLRLEEVMVGPAGGHISVGAVPRSYQVTPAGPSHPMSAQRAKANPKAAVSVRAKHRVIQTQPPRMRHDHPDTECLYADTP
jgi:hypothetical protein